MNEILLAQQLPIPHITLISGNLRHPVSVGIMDNASQPDLAGKYIFKKQYMLTLQSMRRYQLICGKVTRRDYILVRIEKKSQLLLGRSLSAGQISCLFRIRFTVIKETS